MIAAPLSIAEAEALVEERLGATPRAAHSRFVARLMGGLADRLGEDRTLWMVVGLVHDLDYFEVEGNWSRHGLQTERWLEGRLPEAALAAIMAHDHRTGVRSDTPLADMLRVADALAVLDEGAGRDATLDGLGTADKLRILAGERGYLAEIIAGDGERHVLPLPALAEILAPLPRQLV